MAVLAHPGQLRLPQQDLFGQIQHMKEEGLQGLECYHNAHAPATQVAAGNLPSAWPCW